MLTKALPTIVDVFHFLNDVPGSFKDKIEGVTTKSVGSEINKVHRSLDSS